MTERDDLTSSSRSASDMSPTLEEMAAQAATRAQKTLAQLSDVLSNADSVALLATLSSLRLTHAQGEEIDVDAFARWQAKLEFLTWVAAATASRITNAAAVDGELIERVEELLEQYFNDESLAVAGSNGDAGADPELRSLHRTLLVGDARAR